MSNKFLYSCNSTVNSDILDGLRPTEKIISLNLNIKASHAGKVNGNYVFYTPRSMRIGSGTLTTPFKKHLQKLHRGDAVGVINEAYYSDYTDNYSEKIKTIADRIENATNQKELVKAVKDLVKHSEYNETDYKGLGVLTVNAELFDNVLINDLTTGDNKGKVSIGGNATRVYCSECGELFGEGHKHKRGQIYNGAVCFAIYDNMFLDHIGFVPDPADTSTETSIIQDSLDLYDNEEGYTVTIDNFKIQDNKQGNLMNIEQLKQLATNVESLVGHEIFKDLQEVQKESLKGKLAEAMKATRKSSYLFTDDKLLSLASKESVAVVSLLVDQLEESAEKVVLQGLLSIQKEKHFKEDENITEYVNTLFLEEKVDETNSTTEETTKTDKTTEEAENNTTNSETLEATEYKFDNEAFELMIAKAVDTSISKFFEKQKEVEAEVKDSTSYELLINTNKQLSTDIATLDAVNTELTNKYKTVIINQILALQDKRADTRYAEILAGRELNSLADTLESLEYLAATKENEELDTTGSENTTTEETMATENISDSKTTEEELEKTSLEDSLDNLKIEDNNQTADDTVNELEVLQTKGLAAYLKLKKGKENKINGY